MAAIFKNGGYECRISQNAPYLKLDDQKMYILSQKVTFYVKLFMKYAKASFLFSMAAILNIAKNGGSIKISGCFHQNSEIVWHGGHLCQITCFCPDVKMYYIKNPHYIYAFLFRSTLIRKLNSELVCLVPLDPQVNKLYCPRSLTRFHNHGLCKMLQIKCHGNINRVISVVCCIRDSLPSTVGACTDFQTSQLAILTTDQYRMQVA